MFRLCYGTQRIWLPLVLCLLSFLPLGNSQNSGTTSADLISSSFTSEGPTETVDISSALAVAASVAPMLAMGNFTNPIPLPTDAPNYKDISQLAAVFPPLEQFAGEPDIDSIAEVPANISNQVQKRQGAIRVMAVGDSMTHCREGDFTWRYRLWSGQEAKTWPLTL